MRSSSRPPASNFSRLPPCSLEGLSAAAARSGAAERGARLLGAAGALLEETGLKFEPSEQAMHDRTTQLLREELGEERFRALIDEGISLGVGTADVDDS